MKKILKIMINNTSRQITIPADYFKIHESFNVPITGFEFSHDESGNIILKPIRGNIE